MFGIPIHPLTAPWTWAMPPPDNVASPPLGE